MPMSISPATYICYWIAIFFIGRMAGFGIFLLYQRFRRSK